jgi:hypothetical protein
MEESRQERERDRRTTTKLCDLVETQKRGKEVLRGVPGMRAVLLPASPALWELETDLELDGALTKLWLPASARRLSICLGSRRTESLPRPPWKSSTVEDRNGARSKFFELKD